MTETNGRVTGVAFSTDRRTLAAAHFYGASLWDLQDHQLLWDEHIISEHGKHQPILKGICQGVAFSPHPRGETLCIIDGIGVALLDVAARKPLADGRPDLPGRSGRAVVIPGGRTIAQWVDGRVILWDVANRTKAEIRSVPVGRFSFDGKTVAVADRDSVLLWDVPARRPLTRLEIPGGVTEVQFSPDGDSLALVTKGAVEIWDVKLESWVALAGRIANRNFTREEWAQHFPDERYRQTIDELPMPPDTEPGQESGPTTGARKDSASVRK
jgi:WD40 repeat protein